MGAESSVHTLNPFSRKSRFFCRCCLPKSKSNSNEPFLPSITVNTSEKDQSNLELSIPTFTRRLSPNPNSSSTNPIHDGDSNYASSSRKTPSAITVRCITPDSDDESQSDESSSGTKVRRYLEFNTPVASGRGSRGPSELVIEGTSITLHKTHVLSEENVEFQIRASITEGYPQTILDSSVELSINSPSTNFMSPEISSCDHFSKLHGDDGCNEGSDSDDDTDLDNSLDDVDELGYEMYENNGRMSFSCSPIEGVEHIEEIQKHKIMVDSDVSENKNDEEINQKWLSQQKKTFRRSSKRFKVNTRKNQKELFGQDMSPLSVESTSSTPKNSDSNSLDTSVLSPSSVESSSTPKTSDSNDSDTSALSSQSATTTSTHSTQYSKSSSDRFDGLPMIDMYGGGEVTEGNDLGRESFQL